MWKIIMLSIVTMGIVAAKVTYKDYRLFRITPVTHTHLTVLKAMKAKGKADYYFWKEAKVIGRDAYVMLPPRNLDQFFKIMDDYCMYFRLNLDDIQLFIKDTVAFGPFIHSFNYINFHSLEVIYKTLDELAKTYSNVEVIVGGRTYEGREIKGVKITAENSNEDTYGVFIEGGMHAREWIAPTTIMYILHQLLMSNDTRVQNVAKNYNWFIFPVLNPDGYVYSQEHDRLWMKTRKPSNSTCIGSDPDRNWDFQWNSTVVSNDPCDDDYPGSEPFSEIEIKSMSEYLQTIRHKFDAYFSFHNFGQQLMFPSGYTSTRVSHYDQLHQIGTVGIEAIRKRYNTTYTTGSFADKDSYNLVSGLSIDYVTNVLGKTMVFLYQLRDRGRYGFLIPRRQIIPTGEETLDSLVATVTEIFSGRYAAIIR